MLNKYIKLDKIGLTAILQAAGPDVDGVVDSDVGTTVPCFVKGTMTQNIFLADLDA